ncbi:S-layer homology domain-containing protein [Phosphitispora sp. TUW77]|uniref:S-layer homology domain-containing protein n=1 Tax=Phosphitispora sp. TUW77 TaxID=3152361 RepID=UPI003AB6F589
MRKNKIIALLMITVFILMTATTGVAAKKGVVDSTFNDMAQAQWALKHVYKMKSQNIIKGYPDGSFQPNKPVTHAEAVALVLRSAGLEEEVADFDLGSVVLPYKDAAQIPEWVKKYVAYAYTNGYLEVSESGNFQSNKGASRQWVVKLIVKVMGLEEDAAGMDNVILPFKDAADVSETGYVASAVKNNIINGFPDGTFQPNKGVTRAQIAVMLGQSVDELPIPGKFSTIIEGEVVEVSTDETTISNSVCETIYCQGAVTLDVGDEDEVTYPVDENALIYVNDQEAELVDIEVGATAKLVVDNNGVAVYIEVAPVTVKGVVYEVYADDNTIVVLENCWGYERERNRNINKLQGTIKQDKKTDEQPTEQEREQNIEEAVVSDPVEYTVTNDAVITLNGDAAELGDLEAGNIVTLTLNDDNEAIKIKAYSMPFKHNNQIVADEDDGDLETLDEVVQTNKGKKGIK